MIRGYNHLDGLLMIWLSKKYLVGSSIAYDVVNPKTLELEAAKEILGEFLIYGLMKLMK